MRYTSRRWIGTSVAVIAVLCCGIAAPREAMASPPPTPGPSSIGNELVRGITVSPLYEQTGLVLAMAVKTGCSGQAAQCLHLWISHDGGSSWQRAAAMGWAGGMPAVLITGNGGERLLANAPKGLQQSDDDGDTWHDFGPPGVPTALPSYSRDSGIAVAGGAGSDVLLQAGSSHTVSGSRGALDDMEFGIPATYPVAGGHRAALLSAIDKKTSAVVIEQCDATLSCRTPVPIAGASASMGAPAHLAFSRAYASDGTVFAQVLTSGIYKSTDGGTTFVPLHLGSSAASITEATGLAVAGDYSEAGPDRVAVAAIMQLNGSGSQTRLSGGVYRTADGGTTWQQVGSPGMFDGGATAVALAPDGRIFGGYMQTAAVTGLLCSTDGVSWRASCPAVGHWVARGTPRAHATAATDCGARGCSPSGATGGGANGSATADHPDGAGPNSGGGESLSGASVAPQSQSGRRGVVAGVALGVAALLAALALISRRRLAAE